MANEAKILITEQGAKQTQAAIEQTGAAAKKMGADVNAGAETAAKGNEKVNESVKQTHGHITKTQGLLSKLTGAWSDMIIAGLGIGSLVKVVTLLNEQVQKTLDLTDKASNSLRTPFELGQKMFNQTGVGTQEAWAKKMLEIQKSAGFKETSSVEGFLTSMDIQFGSMGGIANPKIMDLATAVAPTLASMGLSGDEAGGIISLAGQAKVQPTKEAFLDFFGKINAGYSSSQSKNKGRYITGLQTAGIDYMAQGGSLENAISYFSGVLEMNGGKEADAGTTIQRLNRVAAGQYSDTTKTIETAYGVSFDNLSMDQRYGLIISYAKTLPENSRYRLLTEIGIPGEVTTDLNLLTSNKATAATNRTYSSVRGADSSKVAADTEKWLKSSVARLNAVDAEIVLNDLGTNIPNMPESEIGKQITDINIARKKANDWVDDRRMKNESSFWLTDKQEFSRKFADLLAEGSGGESTKSTIPHLSSLQTQSALMQNKIMTDPNYDPTENEDLSSYPAQQLLQRLNRMLHEKKSMHKNEVGPTVNNLINNYNFDTARRSTNNQYTQDE